MTCIIGFAEGGNVWIGGDSAGTNVYFNQRIRVDEKVFLKGDMIFGFTSSFRMGQILRYHFSIPSLKVGQDIDSYLHTTFLDALIESLSDNHYTTEKDNVVRGGNFLFGYKGKLYEIEPNFQISETIDKFDAVGCGDDLAMGAMYTIEKLASKLSPELKIKIGLSAACKFSAGVAPPFKILCLKAETN